MNNISKNKPRVLIQINCLNEEDNVAKAIKENQISIPGIDIEILVVDDGSTDNTYQIAQNLGVRLIKHKINLGLPKAINSGIKYALEHDFDVLINTDADSQYPASYIPQLIDPIINQEADIVYAERDMSKITHFSKKKIFLQLFGARVVSFLAGHEIRDAASGFRAINREAMKNLYLLANFASPLEIFLQGRVKNLAISTIKIVPRETLRPSRIVKSNLKYVLRSATVIIDYILTYKPMLFFVTGGVLSIFFALIIFLLRLYYVIQGSDSEHLTLLAFGLVLVILGVQSIGLGMASRISRANKLLIDEVYVKLNNIEKT